MNDGEQRPSRSQKTRDATAVNKLGLKLIALTPTALDQLELPEDLREAIDVCQRLKIRARSRQKRRVGQLLRAEDHVAIGQRFEALARPPREGGAQEKANEDWRARLLEEGDTALRALLSECPVPEEDAQQLRELLESATRASDITRSKRARRELLRAIRALRARATLEATAPSR